MLDELGQVDKRLSLMIESMADKLPKPLNPVFDVKSFGERMSSSGSDCEEPTTSKVKHSFNQQKNAPSTKIEAETEETKVKVVDQQIEKNNSNSA